MKRLHWNEPATPEVALYAGVAADDPPCQIQLENLRACAQRSGWLIVAEYVEVAGSTTGVRRPQLARLLSDARRRKFDVVLVWKPDRFGQSTLDTLQNVLTLSTTNVRFLCPPLNLDVDHQNPRGQFVLTVLAAIAEMERCFIREWTTAGLKAYREAHACGRIGQRQHSQSGKDLPVGRPRKVFSRDRARELRAQGMSWRAIAQELRVPQATIRLALKDVQKLDSE